MKKFIVGIISTVVGGVLLAIIVGEGRFAPSEPSYQFVETKPTDPLITELTNTVEIQGVNQETGEKITIGETIPKIYYLWRGDLPFLDDAFDLLPFRYDEDRNEVTVGYESYTDLDSAIDFFITEFTKFGYTLTKIEHGRSEGSTTYPTYLYFSPEKTMIYIFASPSSNSLDISFVRSLDANCSVESFALGECSWQASYRENSN